MKSIFIVGTGVALVAALFAGAPLAGAQTQPTVAQLQAQIDSLLKILHSLQAQVAAIMTRGSALSSEKLSSEGGAAPLWEGMSLAVSATPLGVSGDRTPGVNDALAAISLSAGTESVTLHSVDMALSGSLIKAVAGSVTYGPLNTMDLVHVSTGERRRLQTVMCPAEAKTCTAHWEIAGAWVVPANSAAQFRLEIDSSSLMGSEIKSPQTLGVSIEPSGIQYTRNTGRKEYAPIVRISASDVSYRWGDDSTLRNAAKFIKQAIPATMIAGQKYAVSVAFRNSGNKAWDKIGSPGDYNYAYRIKSVGPYDNMTWGLNYVPISYNVMPGMDNMFSFAVTAPSTPGTYNFQWQMNQGGVGWFGEASPSVMVQVVPSQNPSAPVSCGPEMWEVPYGTVAHLTASGGNGNYSWSAPEGGLLMVTAGRQNEFVYRGDEPLPLKKRVIVRSGENRESATCTIKIIAPDTTSKPLVCAPAEQFAWSGMPVSVSVTNLPVDIRPSSVVWSAPGGSPSIGTGQSFTVSFVNTTKYIAVNPVSVSVDGRAVTCYVRVSNQSVPAPTDR